MKESVRNTFKDYELYSWKILQRQRGGKNYKRESKRERERERERIRMKNKV